MRPLYADVLVHLKVILYNGLSYLTTAAADATLLNKTSRLAPALGATKFITITAMNLVTICCAT